MRHSALKFEANVSLYGQAVHPFATFLIAPWRLETNSINYFNENVLGIPPIKTVRLEIRDSDVGPVYITIPQVITLRSYL